jgi:hypothetical protein
VRLLLRRSAPVNVKDETHDGTPLGWAVYGWANPPGAVRSRNYHEAVALLVRAGAGFDSEWLDTDDEERQRTVQKLRSDPRMQAALRGELSRG